MPYNEFLADRIRRILDEKKTSFEEKKMMGGLCFLINDKMCVGIVKDDLMARLDPAIYEEVLSQNGCRPMDFTGRPMKGYVFVDAEGTDTEADLQHWIQLALDFNPRAKASKRKH